MILYLVESMPASWQPRVKAIAAAVGITLTVLAATMPQASLWVTIPLAVATALGVYQLPAVGYEAPETAAHRV